MTQPSRPPHPVLLVILIGAMVLIWSFNFIVAKVGLRSFDPLTLASFRVVLSTALLLPVYLAQPHKARFGRADVWKFFQLGLLGVALNQVLFTIGLNYTTVAHSSLIIGMGPIYVLLLAWLQGLEVLTFKKLAGMLISFTGVAVLASEHGISLRGGTLLGDIIILTGSWAFAFYTVMAKKAAKKYDSLQMNTFNYLSAAILILPLALRQGMLLDWRGVSWQGWAALAYMAGLASVAAYLVYFWALRHVTASRLVALGYFHPVLATVFGILLLGEHVTLHLLGGGALVLVGVYLTEVAPAGEREQETGP